MLFGRLPHWGNWGIVISNKGRTMENLRFFAVFEPKTAFFEVFFEQ